MSAELALAPRDRVAAALNYADYAAKRGDGGYPNLWVSKFPAPSAGDRVLRFELRTAGEGDAGTTTRPELCLQILAAEMKRRMGADAAVLRLVMAAKRLDDYHACRLGNAVRDEERAKIYAEHSAAVVAALPFFALAAGGNRHGEDGGNAA